MPSSVEKIVEVAVAMPVHGTFSYRVPEEFAPLVCTGTRVWVPFGRGRTTGYVLGEEQRPAPPELKAILDVLDGGPLFPAAMVPFLRWTADYYMHPIGEVVQTALPGGLTAAEHAVYALTEEGRRRLADAALPLAARRLGELLAQGPLRSPDLRRHLGRDFPRALLALWELEGRVARELRFQSGRTKPLQERWVRLKTGGLSGPARSESKRRILDVIDAAGEIALGALAARFPNAAAHVRELERSGRVEVYPRRVFRDPFGDPIEPEAAPSLTPAQQAAVSAVSAAMGRGFHAFLLNGVTGSGKTEVYLQVTDRAVQAGRCALVLVPEIALIMQTERRFRARFGDGVAVLHSGLSEGERYDQWSRVLQRQSRIVIGARSAVFAPFAEIGVIIVDEEHDAAYKQEGGLHYNARDLAILRGRQCGAAVLLGSATPSLQSFYNARRGKYIEIGLPQRIEERPLPEIQVVDLRRCRDLRGAGRFISAELHQAMAATLARGEQTLLFLNRRGFSSFAVCAACGATLRCRHCDISLTLHQAAGAYRCHYCGFSRPATAGCDGCGADKLKRLGLGTEKVEAAVAALFPGARVARMDRDTTQRKGAVIELLRRLREREIDVLVGTQMVAQGHDFPDITLVGIVCADLSLSFPDFRAGERTFQLLAQVAGRAGRGDRPGRVILQTYSPDHFSIRSARDQDFQGFYRQEIDHRQALGYPPVSRMIQLRILGKDPERTRQQAEELGRACRSILAGDPDWEGALQIMGPIEAAVTRIAGSFRWQILLKARTAGLLHRFMDRVMAAHQGMKNRQTRVVIDVDPYFLL
jgi:primosomal protein N' (replication factor Y)